MLTSQLPENNVNNTHLAFCDPLDLPKFAFDVLNPSLFTSVLLTGGAKQFQIIHVRSPSAKID